jgi:osmotically-inducible protein OsmY
MGPLIRVVLILIVLLVAGFFLLGYWTGGTGRDVVGTDGVIDTDRARQRGAELGERAATATAQLREAANEASLTTKIKAKMALDDVVKARAIDVTTNGTVVAVSGTVNSPAERERALALAKETDGVTRVIDQLRVQ